MVKIDKQHLPKGNKRKGIGMKPSSITVHSTGNDKSTAQNERNYLTNPNNTDSIGWHYVVAEDTIIEAIPPNERAQHTGNSEGNRSSIGIEMVHTGDREKVLDNTIQLIQLLQKEYNIPDSKVVRHYDWKRVNSAGVVWYKNCPSILNNNNWQGWRDFKKRLEVKEPMEDMIRRIAQEEIKKAQEGQAKWAEETIEYVKEKGIMSGFKDGSFKPNQFATRAEVAQVVKNTLESINK